MKDTFEELRNTLSGDFYDDPLYTGIYATDASNYQIKPKAVICPRTEEDVEIVMKYAYEHHIPLLARGGGTSLVGQTVGEGFILDFTKYMNSILELNPEQKWAWVQPGLVRDDLNKQLSVHSLHFAPDPATSSRAAMGGMIANNSSGTRSIMYGKTLDHVLELKVMLDDGSVLLCKDVSGRELEQKLEMKSREGDLYRTLFRIVNENQAEIADKFPKVMRRVGGYNLDEFLGQTWNLSRLIVGSESTLAIILEAKINLVPNPKFQSVCVVHFHSFYDSIAHVREIVKFGPAAVELLDGMLIERSRENLETKNYCDFIEGDPQGALIVEFYGESKEDAEFKANQMIADLKEQNLGYAHPLFSDKQKIENIFTVRKKGLGLLMGVKGNRKPIAFIEDAAVPLESLADYIMEVFEVCREHDTPVVAYAHASVGLLHVKPLLDLRDQEDIERMKKISLATLELVKKYKGSWSGEHGDGLARSPYNESFFGNKLYQALKEVKSVFDPRNILNPGKIVDAPSVDKNLRYGPSYKDKAVKTMFHYRAEGGFHDAVHLCNGVGECRKTMGGTMCPSFRASLDEKDSTRARANALRLAISGQLDNLGLNSPHLLEVMDLCLSCKACKSECPSNVDMAKLKSEVLHHQHQENGVGMADRLILYQHKLSNMASGTLSPLANSLLKSNWFRKLLEHFSGLDARRVLPLYSSKPFQLKTNKDIRSGARQVVLFADTYIKFHDPEIGHSAKSLLEYLGYDVHIFQEGCCQRPAISRGLLVHAKTEGRKTLESLESYMKAGLPILVCEPSCASSLKDDLADLMDDENWLSYSHLIFLLEDFLMIEKSKGNLTKEIKFKSGSYLMHGHCHQKSIFTTASIHQLFNQQSDVVLKEINSGCCGMAGSFGYEKEHYVVSEKIGNLSLLPEIREANKNEFILAQGFSCRHQIEHFTGRKPIHWVESVDTNH